MFLLQPWDKPMKYSDQTVEDAKTKEATFKSFFGNVKALLRDDWLSNEVGWRNPELDRVLADELLKQQSVVHESLLDNFNTPGAVLAQVTRPFPPNDASSPRSPV